MDIHKNANKPPAPHGAPPTAPQAPADFAVVNGIHVPLDLGNAGAFVSIKDLKLPSGKKACIREGDGDTLLDVQEMADVAAKMSGGKYTSEKLFQYGLIAALVRVDDAPITVEQVRRMPLSDVAMLLKEVGDSQGFLSQES